MNLIPFLTLTVATVFAAAAAVAADWLLLRAAFRLMRPASAGRGLVQGKAELVGGTMLLARAFDPRR